MKVSTKGSFVCAGNLQQQIHYSFLSPSKNLDPQITFFQTFMQM